MRLKTPLRLDKPDPMIQVRGASPSPRLPNPNPDAPSYEHCGSNLEIKQFRAYNDFEKALIQVSSNNPTTQLITIVDKKLQKHNRLPVRFFPDLLLQQLHSRYEAAICCSFQTPGVR